MSNTRNLADLLDTSGDIKSAALDNVTPTTSASDLTSGTLAGARIADDTITTAKVADGQITAAKVAADVATQAEIDAKLNLTGGTLTGTLTMESTDAGSAAAPELILYRNSASPADGDYLGQVQFKGENDNGGSEIYAKVTGKITDASNGTEDGLIETAIKGNGSFTIVSRQKSDELQLLNGVNLDVDGSVTATGYTGSGANLTSLPAAQLTGALPAISGANLTNLTSTFSGLTDTTVSTSDPVITTNPSATGHIWVNKSSGESYVCIDATNNANTWKNIGDGTGNIAPVTAATGGTITTDGDYKVHTFTSSGNFVVTSNYYPVEYLVIAGGGGGGNGGGGAGGYRTATGLSVSNQTYAVVVGAGGSQGQQGGTSSFAGINTTGGGGGNSGSGGSGAGAGGDANYGAGNAGSYSPVEGYAGGTGHSITSYYSGGGGGASEVGYDSEPVDLGTSDFSSGWSASQALSISGTNIAVANGTGTNGWSHGPNINVISGRTYDFGVTGSGTGTGVGVYINGAQQGLGYVFNGSNTYTATSTGSITVSIFRFSGHSGTGTINSIFIKEQLATSTAGNGGDGRASSITGSSVTRAGGGGGGGTGGNNPGGAGGGGLGMNAADSQTNGTANTGGGAGGNHNSGGTRAGGSGIVIIRYRFQ